MWVKMSLVLADLQGDLPAPWYENDKGNAERTFECSVYDEDDIADKQIRADANDGFDLRQRAEGNYRAEVVGVKLTKTFMQKWAIDDAIETGDLALIKRMNGSKAAAIAHYRAKH